MYRVTYGLIEFLVFGTIEDVEGQAIAYLYNRTNEVVSVNSLCIDEEK